MSDIRFSFASRGYQTFGVTRKAGALWGEPTMLSAVKRVLVHDDGQDLIEYALLAAFIALAAVRQ